MQTSILVTGGGGFVGKALVRRLKEENENKRILAPRSKELDLLDYNKTVEFIQKNNVKVVYHVAAVLGGVGTAESKKLIYLENNLLLNYNIVKASIV